MSKNITFIDVRPVDGDTSQNKIKIIRNFHRYTKNTKMI